MRSLFACALFVLAPACGHSHDGDQFICDGDEVTPSAGVSQLGGMSVYQAMIVGSTPPDVHHVDSNELVVELQDPSGNVASDAIVYRVETFTAKHDHGSPVTASIEALGNGQFRLSDLNYVHRGPWHVFIDITDSSGVMPVDTVRFTFCIAELAQ